MTIEEFGVCQECGMAVGLTDYHPFAACLMFKACRNSLTVRANLQAVIQHGIEQKEPNPLLDIRS